MVLKINKKKKINFAVNVVRTIFLVNESYNVQQKIVLGEI